MLLFVYETSFNCSVHKGDKNIKLDGYNLIREDHPGNVKQIGVCIFYKENLGASIFNSLSLSECI